MININIQTMLIHMVFFLIVVVLINELLLKPMLAVMDKRKQSVEGNQQAAREADAEAREMKSKFSEQIGLARKEAAQEREKVRKTAAEEEAKIIKESREKAGNMLADLREKIAAEYRQAQESLKADSEAMGKDIAARILGRSV